MLTGVARRALIVRVLCAIVASVFGTAAADDFYRGKTIRLVVGTAPGGGYDLYSRLLAQHLPRHLDGQPAIVVENMPGAGTLVAANAVYRGSKPDGLTVLNMHGGQVLSQILGRPGVGFDARKFVWVGAPARVSVACALTRRTGIATVGDWAHAGRPIKLGGIAPGDSTHDAVRILQATLGLPIQLVRGYKGTADIRLAAESGEVAGGCWQWESMKATWRNALETGDVRVVLQVAATPLSDLPGVPNALDLAPTPDARRLLSSGIVVPTTIARLYALPPATPRERVATLRAAFLATLRDPKFLADARRANLEVDPVSGEEVERLVGELFHLDSAVVARLREILR